MKAQLKKKKAKKKEEKKSGEKEEANEKEEGGESNLKSGIESQSENKAIGVDYSAKNENGGGSDGNGEDGEVKLYVILFFEREEFRKELIWNWD